MENITIGQIIAFVGTVITIVSFFIGLYKIVRNLERLKDNIDENTMYTLKLVILNKELSLEERIHAGDRYIALNGNGYVKHVYEGLLKELDERGN